MKAAGYLRRAALTQEDTTDRARSAVQAYAEAHGLQVVAWYTDAAVSGLVPFDERPAGAALLSAAAGGEFAVVLVSSWNRIGRAAAVVNNAAARLAAVGVKLESLSDGGMR
jgi:DNA invertase Pin-like site-specific DNA recombinase